jgi:hypothetical protein
MPSRTNLTGARLKPFELEAIECFGRERTPRKLARVAESEERQPSIVDELLNGERNAMALRRPNKLASVNVVVGLTPRISLAPLAHAGCT